MKSISIFLSVFFSFLCTIFTYAQQLAFPGAEGFGRYTTGGRGGNVYHVTNLNDSGAGSFRDAVSQSNRIVVFDVGGVINIQERIVIHSNITVAGQTAPGDGVTIYGNGIAFNDDSGNNIIRYLRIRMGKNGDSGKDAVSISAGQNYIFDHVSISWGRDGTLDVNGSGIDNLTFQDCIISQGINNTNHSTGGLMQSGKWSMIRSLYIDNKTRNPKARGTHEFINSVLYNWAEHGYIMGDTQGLSECNLVGNYFIYGPSSNSNTHITGTTPSFHVYANDNWVDSNKDGALNGVTLTDYKTATVESSPYPHPGVINLLSAQDALSHVIQNAGASIVRDEVDELLINQLTSYGTAGQIINTEDDNGIPGNVGVVNGGAAPADADQDGMPDSWETANGLNPNSPDHNGDMDNDGFTNIEEYFDWIVNGSGGEGPGSVVFDGNYSIIAAHSGKAVDTYNFGTGDGTNIVQWDYWGGDAQRFSITPVDSEWHRITPVISSGQGFDVDGISTASGANIHTWTYWGGDNQQFRFQDAGNGYYNIIARHSGKCLDVENASTADGANIQQWNCSGAEQQKFQMTVNNGARHKGDAMAPNTDFALYPNPANDLLHIYRLDNLEGSSKIAIYDHAGRRVHSSEIIKDRFVVDISDFSSGIYIVKVLNAQGVLTKKFIKK